MGATTQPTRPGPDTATRKGCVWGTATANFLQMDVRESSSPAEADAAYEDALSSSDQLEDVSGLGDKACWAGKSSRLFVLKGKYWVTISAFPREKEPFDAAYAAAELAIPRLP